MKVYFRPVSANAALACILALTTACLGFGCPVRAEVHALLVGVSTYPSLGPEFTLRGPGNDIAAARDFLHSRGISPTNITVLADGMDDANGDPTLQGIENALENLQGEIGPDDIVYLHFAGHGSQQLGAALDEEADKLDEVFLPMDTQPMDEAVGVFPNALSDDLLRSHITKLRNTGAFVWLVFDSCHSGGMTRGAGGGQERRVRLALDPRELRSLRRRLAQDGTTTKLPQAPTIPDLSPEAGGFAAFFAAQDYQATLERRMLANDDRVFGVFSFNLFSVLNRTSAISYREAANAVLATYAAQGEVSAIPKFEGIGLDKAVLGREKTTAAASWPIVIEKQGETESSKAPFLTAGRLHGLAKGDEITVFRIGRAGTDAVGSARVEQASAFRSRLFPLDDKTRRAFAEGEQDTVLWGKSAGQRFIASIDVALPPPDAPAPLLRAVEHLQAERLGDEAQSIRWVAFGEPAALRLLPTSEGAVLTAADGVIDDGGHGASPAVIQLPGPIQTDAAILHQALTAAAKARRLMTLALDAAAIPFDQAIDLRLQVSRVAPVSLDSVASRSQLNCGRVDRLENEDFVNGVTVLRHCDLLSLKISNRSQKDWDITVLFLGARNDLAVLFPPVGQSNRIHAGDRLRPLQFAAYTEEGAGPPGQSHRDQSERLIVLAQEAKPGYPEADFRFLADDVSKGAARGAGMTGYGGLIASMGAATGLRSGGRQAQIEAGPVGTATVLRWILRRGG